jgi:type I restriction enzyme, S subunit
MRVDKSKWQKIFLGEVCNLYQPKTIATSCLDSNGKYLVYGANGVIGKYNEYNHKFPEVLITCRGATCGTINISKPFSWINGNAMVVHPKEENLLDFAFLGKAVSAIDYSKVITGAAQPQITRANLQKVQIVIPTLVEQQTIASELDAVQEMIDGYKAQIADLDALAQSIFLDMFGNVSMNDKSWNIIPMGKLGDFKNGLNYNKGEQGKSIKIIGVGDFQNIKSLSSFNDISSIEVEHISEEYLLHNEDIVFVRSNGNKNLVGRCLEVYPNDAEVTFSGFCIRFRKSVEISNKYLIALLTDSGFKKTHLLKSNGIGIQNINQKLLSSLPIPVPSADLQQLFALKVETIEQQKEQLRLQLQDAETLMAERMQYYFS